MIENKKVSVIVPIYNVERYIYKCVKSLMLQDYCNIEIILVDDGSPDNSGRIIDELSKEDKRIIVIHKTNGGVSTARNSGLLQATGEYVMFVDGDDWVEKDYVSYFLNIVQKDGLPIGMNKNNFHTEEAIAGSGTNYVVSAEKAIEWLYTGELFVGVWNKIYSRDFLLEHDLQFDETIWYGEGMLFNIECLQHVNKVAVGEKPVYHQTSNPDSAMRKFNLESNLCGIRSLDKQKQIWKKKTKAIENEWLYHRYRFNKAIIKGLIQTGAQKQHQDIFKECVHNVRKNIMVPVRIEKSIKTKIWWIGFAICPDYMVNRETFSRHLKTSGLAHLLQGNRKHK